MRVRPRLLALGLVVASLSCGPDETPPVDACDADNHCVREGDDAVCEAGYDWAFPNGEDRLTCAPVLSGDDVAVGPGSRTHEGNLVIDSAEGLREFIDSDIGEVDGALTIVGPIAVETVELPNLLSVQGSLTLIDLQVRTLAFPELLRVRDDLRLSGDDDLEVLRIDALVSARSVSVNDARDLRELALPAFNPGSIDEVGDISLSLAPALETVALDAFAAGDVLVSSTGLKSLSLPALVSSSSVIVRSNPRLFEIQLPVLPAVPTLTVSGGDNLGTIAAPLLEVVSGSFELSDNRGLHTLELPALKSTPVFIVRENPSLSSCAPLEIYTRVKESAGEPGVVLIRNNGGECEDRVASCAEVGCAGSSLDASCTCDGRGPSACADYIPVCDPDPVEPTDGGPEG